MASIHKYLAEGKGTERQRTRWRVYYKNDKDKWTSKAGFKTKAEAQQFMSGVEVAVSRNEYVTPSDSRATVEQLAPAWLHKKETSLRPSSYRPLEAAWRNHVAPRLGQPNHKNYPPYRSRSMDSRPTARHYHQRAQSGRRVYGHTVP